MDVATLAIKVENGDVVKATTSLKGLEVAGGKTEAATQRLTRRMALLEIEARQMDAAMNKGRLSLSGLAQSMGLSTRAAGALGAAFGAISVGLLVRDFARLSDEYTNLRSRLSLVTTGTANLNAVQSALFDTAQRTRSSFGATADLYGRIARNAGALGASQRDLLQVTESISKALVISGASAAASDAALVQLGQAFASGTLRGEELNSVLEQAPRLADAIAAGMGKTTGELRKLGQEGKLSAKAVFDALKGQAAAIDAEFGQMPNTIGGAMQKIRNELLKAVGGMNEVSGAGRGIVVALEGIASAIGPLSQKFNQFFTETIIGSNNIAFSIQKAWAYLSIVSSKEREKVLQDLREQHAAANAMVRGASSASATGSVSTTAPPPIKPPPVVDKSALRDLEAIQQATDRYYDTLNQRRIDALEAVQATQAQNQATREMIEAYRHGPAAVEALTIAQAGEQAVREAGLGLSERTVAAIRREAQERARLAIELDRTKDAEADAAREAARRADEAQRELERRGKELRRTLSSTIEGFLTDVSNKRNPFVALFENLKRGAIKAVSDILAERFEGKVADLLGIKTPANKQEKAARDMNTAADKMLRAAGQMNGTPSGDFTDVGMGKWGVAKEQFKKAMGIGGAAVGGFGTGYGLGQMTGSATVGAVGGALAGAKMGAAFGPWGAAAGAIAGFAGGIIGAGDAARAARERLRELREAFQHTFDSLRAELNKDTLGQSVAQVQAQYDAAVKQFKEANPLVATALRDGAKGLREYFNTLSELQRMEALRIQQLKEEIAVLRGREREDFQARLDAAIPGNERQEAIDAFNRRADRELEDLRMKYAPTGRESEWEAWERANYAIAEQAIAAEKAAFAAKGFADAVNAATSSVRNAPSGFKLAGYVQEYATGIQPGPMRGLAPDLGFRPPLTTPSQPMASTTFSFAGATFTFPDATDGKEAARAFLAELDKQKRQTVGPNGTRAAALERMTA